MPRSCLLKVEGKVVTIRTFPDGEKMCAIDCKATNQKDYMVHISERTRGVKKQMALRFPRKNSYYWIKVVENKLTVEETAIEKSLEQISDDYWFVMKNHARGKKYSLNPLVAPTAWLSLRNDPPYSFLLTERSQESAQVSTEAI